MTASIVYPDVFCFSNSRTTTAIIDEIHVRFTRSLLTADSTYRRHRIPAFVLFVCFCVRTTHPSSSLIKFYCLVVVCCVAPLILIRIYIVSYLLQTVTICIHNVRIRICIHVASVIPFV